MKLAHPMIFAPDLEQAKAFYAGVLGFAVQVDEPTHLLFSSENAELVVFKCERAGSVGDYSRESRAVFVFEVPSINDAMRDLHAAGVVLLHEAPASGPLGRYAAFVDPFGIVHELLEARH
jgi:glyoxylase I family protein